MSANTGLLTARCDPYGIESTVRILGGMYDQKHMGKNIWYCPERAVSRHRLVCTGGYYGHRVANDGGLVKAHECPGGHQGPEMPLCPLHIRELSVGPPKPGWSKDKTTPHGQVGGSKANEMCPACAFPPEAKELQARADFLHQQMSQIKILAANSGILGFGAKRFQEMDIEQEGVRARLTELYELGIVHKCPLKLVEVS